ncbi:MAG: hypothetical protein WBC91_26485 [Phototrophicaceae bacterium]
MNLSVHPELARLATKSNLQIEFVVWSILQSDVTENNNSSHYTKSQVKKLFTLKKFTPRQWTRIFNKGMGIFWGADYKNLFMRSSKRVIKSLQQISNDKIDTRDCFSKMIVINTEGITTTQDIRAMLYHAWFLARGSVTIARDTIQDTFNLSHDQQRTYEAILGDKLRVYSNHCHIDKRTYDENPQELPSYTYSFEFETFSQDKVSKVTKLAFQLPNTYVARTLNGAYATNTREPQNAHKARSARLWLTNKRYNQNTLYHANMHDFTRFGTMDSYVYVGFQHTKRIFLSGHYI